MENLKNEEIRKEVRKTYSEVAKGGYGCDCGCGTGNPQDVSVLLGYSNDDLLSVPEGANMGLGCGNPQAIASLANGETVIDLGSGGGFDCFLAARAVGVNGHVIGVDMTPDMVSKARENATKANVTNVEFRLGEIENLPVPDNSADVIMSNCVINISPEKKKVFQDAFRVLKKGGRLAITDVMTTTKLPESVREKLSYAGCMAGAEPIDEIKSLLEEIGFGNVNIKPIYESREIIYQWTENSNLDDFIVSASIEAVKP